MGGGGCVYYSVTVRYNISIWSRKRRHKVWGGWNGHVKEDTRPVLDALYKKPKDLSESEREERGHGEDGGVCYSTVYSQIHYRRMVS